MLVMFVSRSGDAAYDPALCAAVRRIFVRVVLGWLSRRAAGSGRRRPYP
jgi:hypothetical protein